MEIPTPPTDNLYKFQALAGLITFVFFICYGWQQFDNTEIELLRLESLNNKIDSDVQDFQMNALDSPANVKNRLNTIKSDTNDRDSNKALLGHANHKLLQILIASPIIIFGSLLFSMMGFHKWYYRVQIYQDQILKNEAELALQEFEAKISERNIKLPETFKIQSQVISNIDRLLIALEKAYEELDYIHKAKKDSSEAIRKLWETHGELTEYLHANRLYLPKDTIQKLEDLSYTIFTLFISNPDEETKLKAEANKLKEALHADFQIILGLPMQDKQDSPKV